MMAFLLVIFACFLLKNIVSLRDGGEHPLVVDYHEFYDYKHLKYKMQESLSISNCSISGDVVDGVSTFSLTKADLTVKVVPPSKEVLSKWGPKSYWKSKTRIFAHVSPNLCSSKRFKELKKGIYKRAKGCYKVFIEDAKGNRVKRFNDYGATLHPEHTRCENTAATGVCDSGATGMQVVEDRFRELHSYPFLVTAERVVIGRGGMFALPCGPFGLFSSCEAVKWGVPLAANEVRNVTLCRKDPASCPHPTLDRVFIMTQYDDTQIGQFMQEALPKLVYHLDFLRANPDIKIHYGFTKQPKVPNWVLPHNYFAALGLLDRLVNGTFYAKQVFMPREGGCQEIGYNAWEAVTMRERFLKEARIMETEDFKTVPPSDRKTILILTRSPGPYTQNKADYTTRRWPKDQFPGFLEALKINFPQHDVQIFSDLNITLMTCPLCQAAAFNQADIAIGMHGAGLSNALFMKPGGVLVEVIHDFDSRHAPIIGIFPRISDIIGLHHFTYYIKDIGLNMVKLANDTMEFANKARLYA